MSAWVSPVLYKNSNRPHSRLDSHLQAASTTATTKMAMADGAHCDAVVACNLPEMLAQDLEKPSAAFFCKDMTAAVPIEHVAPQNDCFQLHMALGGSIAASGLRAALSRRQSLGAIEEQLYRLDLADQGDSSEESNCASDADSDSWMATEPSSGRIRQESVVTTATSVNTQQWSDNSHCSSPKQRQHRCSLTAFDGASLDPPQRSWVDLDIDDDDDHCLDINTYRRSYTMPNMDTFSFEHLSGPNPRFGRRDPHDMLNGSVSYAWQTGYVEDAQPERVRRTSSTPPYSLYPVPDIPDHDKSLLYLQEKRAARQRGKGNYSYYLEHHADPSVQPHNQPSHQPPSELSWDYPVDNYSIGAPTAGDLLTQQRPHTSSGVSSTDRPRLVHINRPSISERRSSLLAFPARRPDSSDGYDRSHSWLSNSSTLHSASSAADLGSKPEPKPESNSAKRFRRTLNRLSGRMLVDATPSRILGYEADDDKAPSRMDDTIDEIILQYDAGERAGQDADHEAGDEAGDEATQDAFHPDTAISNPGSKVHSRVVSSSTVNRTVTNATRPATSQSAEHIRPGIPLSSEVVENLRYSVSGFPDTMLLTSSLSIETIRTYAKKLKRNGRAESPSNPSVLSQATTAHPAAPTAPTSHSHPRWKLSLGRNHKRSTSAESAGGSPGPSPPPAATTITSAASGKAIPIWTCIKTIFPAGSDYRCEALYAHLVAYNYIAAVCGHHVAPTRSNSAPVGSGTRPMSPAPSRTTDADADALPRPVVPKKAASLLGMGAVPASSVAAAKPVGSRMRGLLFGRGRRTRDDVAEEEEDDAELAAALGGKLVDVTLRAGNDVALKEVQAGLVRCVACLVHVLKKPSVASSAEAGDGNWDESENESQAVQAVDDFLFRALCELVRAEEEAAH